MRWAIAIRVCGALGVAVIMGGFEMLITWHNQPFAQQWRNATAVDEDLPRDGIAAVGWALAGFARGVLAGLIWRRVVPAIVTAFAAWLELAYLGATYRTSYLAPLTTTSLDKRSKALTINQWWTKMAYASAIAKSMLR